MSTVNSGHRPNAGPLGGSLADAEMSAQRRLATTPNDYDALYFLGFLRFQQRNLQEAYRHATAALQQRPNSLDALILLSSVFAARGQMAEAIGRLDRALEIAPANANARYNRATLLARSGRLGDALADYDELLKVEPSSAELWFHRGNAVASMGRTADAISDLERALKIDPGRTEVLNNLGVLYASGGKDDEALELFARVLKLAPRDVNALVNSGNILNNRGLRQEASERCRAALAIDANHIGALTLNGNILHGLGRYEEAASIFSRALLQDPNDATLLKNRGLALMELGRFQEALSDADTAVRLRPQQADGYFARGKAYQAMRMHEEAINEYRVAERLDPDHGQAQWNLALSLLTLGRLPEAWPHYERRWLPGIASTAWRPYPCARWNGEYVNGTLMLWGDEGLGDQILYAGMLDELAGKARRVVVEVDQRLVGLFRRSFPRVQVVGMQEQLHKDAIDAHEPLTGVTRFLRPEVSSFPVRGEGYLRPDAERIEAIGRRFENDERAVIGLSWFSRNPTLGNRKSAHLIDFSPLLKQGGLRFVDLQYGDTSAERAIVQAELGVTVERFEDIDNTQDIDGLAALIANCDVVLTTSSTTAHLAGAVGVPTYVMVPHGRGNLWYWFLNQPNSPWYPRVEVRWLSGSESWAALIERLSLEIRRMLGS